MARKARSKQGTTNPAVVALAALLLTAVVLAFASFLHNERWQEYNERFLILAADQQTLVPQIEKDAVDAARADEAAFGRLRSRTDKVEKGLAELKDGNPDGGLPGAPREVQDLLRNVENAWLSLREITDKLLAAKDEITGVSDLAKATGAMLPALAAATQSTAELMVEKDAPAAAVHVATHQSTLLERMNRALGDLLRGGAATVAAIDTGTAAADEFARNSDDLLQGNPMRDLEAAEDSQIRDGLNNAALLFNTMRAGTDELVGMMPAVTASLNDVGRVGPAGADLDAALNDLVQAYRKTPGRLRVGPIAVGPTTVMILGALAALFLVVLGIQLLVDARRRESESKALNDANQQSILRLLDEMGDLADGDLTVEATVTEDITGAIADSINYAVDALRSLVTTINETSEKVASSAQDTRTTTLQLAEASDVQTRQIANATDAIKSMTQAIDEVANNATESAEVASRSVEVAGRGAQTVRDTIQGMDAIREQIQETSKRIKRLGESSQEIGEIVELIDDIADQTNILALNAAMQAAMAGEAGRGFAVVADEVQHLAERSSNATKQIEALVRTIQADTNEAVSSMEASTAGVVEGANLAENAGDALREIENVSTYIADLTRRIADSAQNQSREAGKINSTVTAIQEITRRSADGTRRTADSVETLAELAVELQRSVAGFRLP
jgi:twitching motility protein PilJ